MVGGLFGRMFPGDSLGCCCMGAFGSRLLLVDLVLTGCLDCFWATEFVGRFLGMVALVDVHSLIYDVFVGLA